MDVVSKCIPIEGERASNSMFSMQESVEETCSDSVSRPQNKILFAMWNNLLFWDVPNSVSFAWNQMKRYSKLSYNHPQTQIVAQEKIHPAEIRNSKHAFPTILAMLIQMILREWSLKYINVYNFMAIIIFFIICFLLFDELFMHIKACFLLDWTLILYRLVAF